MKLRLTATLVALVLAALAGGAQQQPQPTPLDAPVFRSTVDAVELDAFVVDAAGNPVTDLTIDDFEVLEDGRPQPITTFAVIDIPIERVEPARTDGLMPDVRSNLQPEGRIYLFAVDEISPSLVAHLRLRLREFVEQHFGEHDTAAIVYVGRGRSTDGQDFTSDRALLLRSIDRIQGGFGASDLQQASAQAAPAGSAAAAIRDTAAQATVQTQAAGAGGTAQGQSAQDIAELIEQQQAAQQQALNQNGLLLSGEGEFLLRQRMQSLRSLVEFMAGIGGRRKSIIYATTGLGTSVYEALDYSGGVRSLAIEDLHAAITAATRGNVTIYPLDPVGLTLSRDITEQVLANSDPLTEVSQTRIGRLQDLRSLAEATGGFAILDTNNFEDGFSRVVRENSTYYVLGFSAATNRADGRFHNVEVRVKRPGLQVRSRKGYLAPLNRRTPIITRASTLAPAVADALQSPISVSGVPMRMFAAPFKGTGTHARVAIAVEFGVDGLALVERSGRLVGDLALALRPTTAEGKLLEGQRHEMALALKPDTFALTKARGLRVLTEMALAPGRYQLRAAGGPLVGKAGSVTYDIEIPNFTEKDLVLSGVALTSSRADETVTVWPSAKPLDGRLPAPFTAAREFSTDETITLYAEIYENANRGPHMVDFKVDLHDAAGRVVSRYSTERPSTGATKAGGHGFVAPIRLANADPGPHVLRIQAATTPGTNDTVTREIPIRVR